MSTHTNSVSLKWNEMQKKPSGKGAFGFSIISEVCTFPQFPFSLLNDSHGEWCCAKLTHTLAHGCPWQLELPMVPGAAPAPLQGHPVPPRYSCPHGGHHSHVTPAKIRASAWWSSAQHLLREASASRTMHWGALGCSNHFQISPTNL